MPKTTISLMFDRETKGTVLYQEVDDKGNPRLNDEAGAVLRSVYIRKAFLKGEMPKAITIELTT